MPFKTGWGYRKEVRYGTEFPGSNLTDFPFYIDIDSDSDIAAELTSGGGITMTGTDGETVIPFGIVQSTPASGTFKIYFLASPLTGASEDDVIAYLYYDSGQSTTEDKAGVVASYDYFMPMEEDPSGSAPQMYDWASESNVGTSQGSMTTGDLVTAKIAKGIDFDGSNDLIKLGSYSPPSTVTVEAIIKPSTTSGYQIFAHHGNIDSLVQNWQLRTNGTALEFLAISTGDAVVTSAISSVINTTSYHYCAGTFGSATLTAYHNGAAGTGESLSDIKQDSTYPVTLGGSAGGVSTYVFGYTGIFDELRISPSARSADWLGYTYTNLFNNSDTVTLGPEEEDTPSVNAGAFFALMGAA